MAAAWNASTEPIPLFSARSLSAVAHAWLLRVLDNDPVHQFTRFRDTMSIKATTTRNGTIGIIEIRGSLIGDGDTDQLRSAVADFIEQGILRLVINLQKVNYLNSSGIGAIISAHASYKKNAGEVKVSGVSGNVQNLLAVTKLIDIFDVYDTPNEAVEAFVKVDSLS